MPSEYLIGMMSGTSADGVDAILVEFTDSGQIFTHDSEFTRYPEALQERINAVAHTNLARHDDPEAIALDQYLAEIYANAAKSLISKSNIAFEKIIALANHGQTVAHRPNAAPAESLQLGDPQLIANLLGLRVISQFRQADLAEGGQGAPLMPAFHKVLLDIAGRKSDKSDQPDTNAYVLNLGGIANISAVPCSDSGELVGFDTGPANTLLNQWIKLHQNVSFDKDGQWAESGTVEGGLLENLMRESYFMQSYPKSTGPDHFNLAWLARLGGDLSLYKPENVQATLLALTVETVKLGLSSVGGKSGSVYVCGGGSNNRALMKTLSEQLENFEVTTTQSIGVAPDWVEAAGFAWLGHCYIHRTPSNYPSVTGATKRVVLGEEFLPK